MELTNSLTIEHTIIASNQPYEKVLEALKARMGSIEGPALRSKLVCRKGDQCGPVSHF